MKLLTVSGKTIEEAIQKAAQELETTKERLSYRVIEEPKKGFLGFLGSKSAKIEAYIKPDPVEQALLFLQTTLAKMEVNAEVINQELSGLSRFNIYSSDDLGRIIGKRGQTLDSLEYLTNLVANRQKDSYVRIELDAENYREKRKETLEVLAKRVGKKVKETQQKTRLEPMSAAERKVIHSVLQNVAGIQTHSEGQGINRYVVVEPKS